MKIYLTLLLLLAGCSVTPPAQPSLSPAKPPVPSMKAIAVASAFKGYSVQLAWTPYVDLNANMLRVWQGNTVIQQVPPQTTSVVVGGLNYRVQYFWHLTASGPGGQSAPSGTVGYIKQNAQQPGIPTGSSAQ